MANTINPDQTAPGSCRGSIIGVYSVCFGVCVQKIRVN